MATTPTASAPPRRSAIARFWGFIMFLVTVGAAAVAVFTFMQLKNERDERAELEARILAWNPKFEAFKGAVRDVDRHLSSVVFQEVDLAASGWQPIAGGFYVIDLGVSPQGKGVKISGKIINPTSVTHENAQLSLKIGEKKATFSLPHVPPAVAQPFDVTLADVPPAEAKRAYLALDSSTISFASSTTRRPVNGGPVDTDKLLK
ncbi:MAG TPA: hypothetical protein VHK47_08970 [Polyangia bacterium]|jgi:hypothetical protein|nr:hypothetical protein [Polyangia bacterium]